MAIFEVLNNQQSYLNRYFRRNVGDDDYATIPEVTLAGDFVIEFDLLPTLSGSFCRVLGVAENTSNRLIINANGSFNYKTSIESLDGAAFSFTDGIFNAVKIKRTGVLTEIIVNGVVKSSSEAMNSPLYINQLFRQGTNTGGKGILANLKIYDAGTLVRDYPLDDNSDTIRDKANGQNGTIINGNADDWGLFDKQANGDWKGNGLAVPPWDSVDQVLEVV